MNQPWSCPSPSCAYRGSAAIHTLEVMGKLPDGHMTSAELSRILYEERQKERSEYERNTVVLQAELPAGLFTGLAVSDIAAKVLSLWHLVRHAERISVADHEGRVIFRSPVMPPMVTTALLTMRWPAEAAPRNETEFWTLARRGYEAFVLANEVKLTFPNNREAVLKDRRGITSSIVEVPA